MNHLKPLTRTESGPVVAQGLVGNFTLKTELIAKTSSLVQLALGVQQVKTLQ